MAAVFEINDVLILHHHYEEEIQSTNYLPVQQRRCLDPDPLLLAIEPKLNCRNCRFPSVQNQMIARFTINEQQRATILPFRTFNFTLKQRSSVLTAQHSARAESNPLSRKTDSLHLFNPHTACHQ